MFTMNWKSPFSMGLIIVFITFLSSSVLAQKTIQLKGLSARPVLDGSASEWKNVKSVKIPLKGSLGIKSVDLKAGTFGDEVFFLVQWKDSTQDIQHKPFVWNAAKKKYDSGNQKEDRFAIQFEMTGEYTTDWISGNLFEADTWHWKAARSNPAQVAQDKMTIITSNPTRKSYKTKAKNGSTIYILRPSDKGDKLYKTARYSKREKDMMPKYIINKNPKGSIADVKTNGVWKKGMWTLEMQRKLNTGHPDDVVFRKGSAVKGGIAVFNRSGDDKHDVSETLTFQF